MVLLNKRVLVLDRGWNATNVINAKEALCKLYAGDAFAMDDTTYALYEFSEWVMLTCDMTEDIVNTPSVKFSIPNVIVLKHNANKKMARMAKLSRLGILVRDNHQCAYCGIKLTQINGTWDHVVPRSKNGKSDWTNLVAACQTCNVNKSNKDLNESGYTLRIKPYHPTTLQIEKLKLAYYMKRDIPTVWKDLLKI